MTHPRSAFGGLPQGGDASGPAEPAPRRLLVDMPPQPLRGPLPLDKPAYRLAAPSDWTFELINEYHEVIRHTAQRYGLDTYPNQLEIITAEQMMDAYASVGMPVNRSEERRVGKECW